jgi:hypothetical protein
LKPWKGSGAVDGLWNNEDVYSQGVIGMWSVGINIILKFELYILHFIKI